MDQLTKILNSNGHDSNEEAWRHGKPTKSSYHGDVSSSSSSYWFAPSPLGSAPMELASALQEVALFLSDPDFHELLDFLSGTKCKMVGISFGIAVLTSLSTQRT